MKVAVLGASSNPARFSNKAILALRQHGHQIFPIHPQPQHIHGIDTLPSLRAIPEAVDILTMYVGPDLGQKLASDIMALSPKMVVFNPGSESKPLQEQLQDHKISYIEACTLVLLNSGQFGGLLTSADAV